VVAVAVVALEEIEQELVAVTGHAGVEERGMDVAGVVRDGGEQEGSRCDDTAGCVFVLAQVNRSVGQVVVMQSSFHGDGRSEDDAVVMKGNGKVEEVHGRGHMIKVVVDLKKAFVVGFTGDDECAAEELGRIWRGTANGDSLEESSAAAIACGRHLTVLVVDGLFSTSRDAVMRRRRIRCEKVVEEYQALTEQSNRIGVRPRLEEGDGLVVRLDDIDPVG